MRQICCGSAPLKELFCRYRPVSLLTRVMRDGTPPVNLRTLQGGHRWRWCESPAPTLNHDPNPPDNAPTLAVLLGKPKGLLALLDEECRLPNGTDKPVDTAAALASGSTTRPPLPQPSASALPLLLGSGLIPFEATRQPSRGRPKAENLRPNPLAGTHGLLGARCR